MKLNRILAGVVTLTLAFAGCSGADPEPVAPPITTTPELVDLATEDFIPMSYLVKRSMAGYTATALGGWFGECIGESLWGSWQSDGWRKRQPTILSLRTRRRSGDPHYVRADLMVA